MSSPYQRRRRAGGCKATTRLRVGKRWGHDSIGWEMQATVDYSFTLSSQEYGIPLLTAAGYLNLFFIHNLLNIYSNMSQ